MGWAARLMAVGAVAGTGLAVVSGAAGWHTAHPVLAAVAVPPLTALVATAWVTARRQLPPALVALALFGFAALLTGRGVHLALAALAFGATVFLAASVFRSTTVVAEQQLSFGNSYRGSAARDYVTLTKPRIMSLLLLTGGAGAFVGARGAPSAGVFAATMLGLALACGGASALNHYLDRDIDRLMGARTEGRPVASGRLEAPRALEFGLALSAASFALLDSLVNLPTALLALAGNLFYVLVYTRWLKRTTAQNIVIGGAAGAVPPLVGFAGSTGHLGWAAAAMFAVVFVWTPPHFWALALMLKEHYRRAGVPMLPVARGDRETARQIVAYTVVLVVVTLVPAALGVFGLVYAVAAILLGGLFAWYAFELRRSLARAAAVRLFHYSLLYLALLFVAMAMDSVI
jgi:protoheme IX farnesyltransferase